jgi:hypothetical protein
MMPRSPKLAGIALAVGLCAILQPSIPASGAATEIQAVSVKRIARNRVEIAVKVTNHGDSPIFLEESGRGNPWILHSVTIVKVESAKRWIFVGPPVDIQALSVIRLDPGQEVQSVVDFEDPFRTFSGTRIALAGTFRAEVRYFSSEDQWRQFMDEIYHQPAGTNAIKPQVAISAPFSIPAYRPT